MLVYINIYLDILHLCEQDTIMVVPPYPYNIE
jgi:hypothetical protein